MKLRWVIKRRTVTAEMVRNYAKEHDIPMMLAKKELEDVSEPILQQYVPFDPFGNGKWEDVPVEFIER